MAGIAVNVGSIQLQSPSGAGKIFKPGADTKAARGAIWEEAIADAAANDLFLFSPGEFLGTLNTQKLMQAGQKWQGAGRHLTRLKVPSNNTSLIAFKYQNGCVIEDCSLETVNSGDTGIGTSTHVGNDASSGTVQAALRNVYMSCNKDCIYVVNNHSSLLTLDNCLMRSGWDHIVWDAKGAGSVLLMNNCEWDARYQYDGTQTDNLSLIRSSPGDDAKLYINGGIGRALKNTGGSGITGVDLWQGDCYIFGGFRFEFLGSAAAGAVQLLARDQGKLAGGRFHIAPGTRYDPDRCTVGTGATFNTFSAPAQQLTKEITANYTATLADSGRTIVCNGNDLIVTLPAADARSKNFQLTVVSGQVGGSIGTRVSPVAADQIRGLDFTAADNKDAINTVGTMRVGDSLTLYCDGSLGYVIRGSSGTWAREA